MKEITRITLLTFICFSVNIASFAQMTSDSLKIVKEALQMIHFPEPKFDQPFQANFDAKSMADMGFEQPNSSKARKFEMRDGIQIHAQEYEHTSNNTIILIHGVLSSSYTFNRMAGLLRENLNAKVIAIDLRGHGMSGGTPGDVSNSNQYAEDLNDLIIALKQENPQQKIILAGHSMGGGIILRHKESFPQTEVAAYLLFAPNLGVDAPTISKELNLNNNFIKTHLSRGLGLKMLNEYNIHTYDSLKVVFYNLPEQMPIKSYSYRSMEAITPKNINATLRTIQKPMIVFVGSVDEAFIAEEYPPLFKANSSADCHIIQGESHNGIRHNKEAMEKIHQWAIKNQLK